ncbi:hypothetical protein F4802DRAFT_91116 [Xylaria palmicola]|nr:hypothetical protein F4802DRAFT_91116 [Xylaria palmicola]
MRDTRRHTSDSRATMPTKKRSQARLTFEPAGPSSSSPVSSYSPARVRYAKATHSSPARRQPSMATSSSPAQAIRGSSKRRSKQARLDGSLAPPASFMPKLQGRRKRAVDTDSSDDSAAEVGDAGHDEDDVDLLPTTQRVTKPQTSEASDFGNSDEEPNTRHPRSSQSVSTRLQRTVIDDEDDDDDDDDDESTDNEEHTPPKVSSPLKRRRPSVISLDDSDDSPIVARSSKKLSAHPVIELGDSDEDIVSPTKRRKMSHHSSPNMPNTTRTPGRLKRPGAATSSPIKKAHKGHRSEKQKKMELLRRRRAGEKIEKLTSSESSSGEDEKRGIYDSDSECEFEALKEFDDEEDEEEEEKKAQGVPVPRKDKHKEKRKREKPTDHDSSESGLDDFVTDDDDAPLGAPLIPLEFTSHAHKPLKDQFPFVIEWLVHNRINPAFERKDPVYANAWRKLDDEVTGLAHSKFTSAAWKADFSRALKARPGLESFDLAQLGAGLHETCEACGRSGHPSTFKIVFSGAAYHKDTLAEVESDSDPEDDDEDGDDDDDDDAASVDAHGMPLPPAGREWLVGAVCCANAETAHSLLHWRHALKQWVDERLEDEGWMTGAKLRDRERMRAGHRRALANGIVDRWQEGRVVAALYGDFRSTLENARNQATTGRGMRGRFR